MTTVFAGGGSTGRAASIFGVVVGGAMTTGGVGMTVGIATAGGLTLAGVVEGVVEAGTDGAGDTVVIAAGDVVAAGFSGSFAIDAGRVGASIGGAALAFSTIGGDAGFAVSTDGIVDCGARNWITAVAPSAKMSALTAAIFTAIDLPLASEAVAGVVTPGAAGARSATKT